MALKPGERLSSVACNTQVVVVRAPADPVELTCAGEPMAPAATATPAAEPKTPPADAATAPGKRYEDVNVGLELLCTRGGGFIPELGGRPLTLKVAKPLPASD